MRRMSSDSLADALCIICCDDPRNVYFEPCRHHVACDGCAARLRDCPMCRASIERRVACAPEEPSLVFRAASSRPDGPRACTVDCAHGSSLIYAASNGHLPYALGILELCPGAVRAFDDDHRTALYAAVEGGHATIVSLLLQPKYAAPIDAQCTDKLRTALHAAAAANVARADTSLAQECVVEPPIV